MITEFVSLEPVAWLIRGVLLSCGVWMAGFALRHRSASGRALLWRAGLAGLVVTVPVVMAGWRFAPLERKAEATAAEIKSGTGDGITSHPETVVTPDDWSSEANQGEISNPDALPAKAAATAMTPPVWEIDSHHGSRMVWAVWGLGAMLVAARWGVAVWRRRQLALASTPVAADSEWAGLMAQVAGPGRRVWLLRSPHVTVPCAWGIWRPTIVLPAAADGWPLDHRRMALAHEWAHLQRRDPFWLAVAMVALALHWANPLAWLMVRRWRLAEEQVADDAALVQAEPRQYAALLVACARSIRAGEVTPEGVASMAHPSTVPQRVRRILDPHQIRLPASRLETLMIVISCVLAWVGVAAATPELIAQNAPPDAAPASIPPPAPVESPAEKLASDPAVPTTPLTIQDKLRSIVIPAIVLEQASLEESVEFLRMKSRELDTSTADPNQRGVNFILRLGQGKQPNVSTLNLTNVPLGVALKAVCDLTGVKFRVEPFAVIVSEKTQDDTELNTRVYLVRPDFLSLAGGPDAGSGGLGPRPSALDILKQAGIQFPEGSTAFFSSATSTLTVRHTPAGLDMVDQWVESISPRLPKIINLRAEIYRLPKARALAVAESLDTKLDASEVVKELRSQAGKPDGATLVAAPSMQTRSGQRARAGSGIREAGNRPGRSTQTDESSGAADSGEAPALESNDPSDAARPSEAIAPPGSDFCLFEAEATLGADGHTLDVSATVTLGTPASNSRDEGAAGTSSLTSSTTLYAGQARLVGTFSGGGHGDSMLLVFLRATVAAP